MTARIFVAMSLVLTASPSAVARQADVRHETRTLLTYPYDAPDPVPMLARDARLYPYHAYDGYAVEGRDSSWTTLRLENGQVVAWVLPDVGGKIWGAIEKSGGQEFIYRNEVMKFRNIALRGPWTSGGVELNFGVIGHAPWTASAVDYAIVPGDDGSVSVVVGAMDLPSRTHWRVRVSVPTEGAYVQTDALWYNPTPWQQPYYNWMTAAAFARDDLQLAVPGDEYLRHSGEALPWPVDTRGRTLSRYADNTFEGHKSYHVVGAYDDFFGGYYEDQGWGFGHWASYDDMPGQKMWLWALSDEGAIWEDLLTDTDGQYVEWQAGRLLVQYAPGTQANPVTQAAFDPFAADRWTERWFPVVGTGGLSAVSDRGVMHVEVDGDGFVVGINAFVRMTDTLVVASPGMTPLRRPLDLEPLVPVRVSIPNVSADKAVVRLDALDLHVAPRPDSTRLDRPFHADPAETRPAAHRLAFEGRELYRARHYADARERLEQALEYDPGHAEALSIRAELDLRTARYDDALRAARRLLRADTYDARANWLAGLAYRALGRLTDADESFGWAFRSTAYRAAAATQRAELALASGHPDRALDLAGLAASYDPDAFAALQVQALALRISGQADHAAAVRRALLDRDPLHHFARAEAWLAEPTARTRDALASMIRSELPEQTWLELAIDYDRRGRSADAAALLALSPAHPLVLTWRAWLLRDSNPEAAGDLLDRASRSPPGFVFPYRPESLPVLDWAASVHEGWMFTYWRALAYWALDHTDAASDLLRSLDDLPDYGPAYAARAALLDGTDGYDAARDLQRAVRLAPDVRQLWMRLVDLLGREGRWPEALETATRASGYIPGAFDLSLARVRALLETGQWDAAVDVMDTVRVLPSEMGRLSRRLYEWAYLARSLQRAERGDFPGATADVRAALRWPRRLGQGRPYEYDERVPHGLLALLHDRLGDGSGSAAYVDSVISWTRAHPAASPTPAALVHDLLLRHGRTSDAAAVRDMLAVETDDPVATWAAERLVGVATSETPSPDDLDLRIFIRAVTLAHPDS